MTFHFRLFYLPRCAKAAKSKGLQIFAVQDFGDCLSGPQAHITYNYYGNEDHFIYRPSPRPWRGCIDQNHQQCSNDTLTCVGMQDANYVYYIEQMHPQDGGYTPWSNWSECDEVCNGGKQYRDRNCTNPKPAYGGRNCSWLGEADDQQVCNEFPCPGNIKIIGYNKVKQAKYGLLRACSHAVS